MGLKVLKQAAGWAGKSKSGVGVENVERDRT